MNIVDIHEAMGNRKKAHHVAKEIYELRKKINGEED
jgi:hypothetical protein